MIGYTREARRIVKAQATLLVFITVTSVCRYWMKIDNVYDIGLRIRAVTVG
jgi:hypothetical protein